MFRHRGGRLTSLCDRCVDGPICLPSSTCSWWLLPHGLAVRRFPVRSSIHPYIHIHVSICSFSSPPVHSSIVLFRLRTHARSTHIYVYLSLHICARSLHDLFARPPVELAWIHLFACAPIHPSICTASRPSIPAETAVPRSRCTVLVNCFVSFKSLCRRTRARWQRRGSGFWKSCSARGRCVPCL